MKTGLLPEHGKGSLWRVLALACAASALHGQQPPGYSYPPPPGYVQPAPAPSYPSQPPAYPQQRYPQQGYAQPEYQTEYVSPIEFLPTFGRKFGNMFRRVFYGDSAPSDYSPHGYPMPGSGHSLDSAPPSYQSHYGQQPQTGIIDPRYEQPRGYPQQPPVYRQPPTTSPPQQPGVPQYQTPPPQRQAASPSASQPGSRMGSSPAPRTALKPAPAPAPKTSPAPPKKYIPPTITKKPAPTMEEMPPPADRKKETAAAQDTEYYPLPGSKPNTEVTKPSSTSKPSSGASGGNNGAFLKGKKASKEGRVISPYPPYQELDVTGLSSGSLALDPTTQKVFEVP